MPSDYPSLEAEAQDQSGIQTHRLQTQDASSRLFCVDFLAPRTARYASPVKSSPDPPTTWTATRLPVPAKTPRAPAPYPPATAAPGTSSTFRCHSRPSPHSIAAAEPQDFATTGNWQSQSSSASLIITNKRRSIAPQKHASAKTDLCRALQGHLVQTCTSRF